MPKRKIQRRFVTPEEIMGKDAWVIVAMATVAERRNILVEYEKAAEAEDTQKAIDLGAALIRKYVKEWNWVNVDGTPMPQVSDDPTVVERLVAPETQFLSECIGGMKHQEDLKN